MFAGFSFETEKRTFNWSQIHSNKHCIIVLGFWGFLYNLVLYLYIPFKIIQLWICFLYIVFYRYLPIGFYVTLYFLIFYLIWSAAGWVYWCLEANDPHSDYFQSWCFQFLLSSEDWYIYLQGGQPAQPTSALLEVGDLPKLFLIIHFLFINFINI